MDDATGVGSVTERYIGFSGSLWNDRAFPSGPFTSTCHQECGFTFSTLVSTPVMVNCFCVSNSAFAEWWARAGVPIVSSASTVVLKKNAKTQ